MLISWSTGKDSAWMLRTLKTDPEVEIQGIFTTINKDAERTAMHAVRLELLKKQSLALKLPLRLLEIPYPCPNTTYESIMNKFTDECRLRGIQTFAFGDLFLKDIRNYREQQFKNSNIRLRFPLWEMDTMKLANQMISGGLKAIVTCVDLKRLPADFAGREFDQSFLNELPEGVDPCGEFGEFHTFVYDSPDFSSPIAFSPGLTSEKDGFAFADLIP